MKNLWLKEQPNHVPDHSLFGGEKFFSKVRPKVHAPVSNRAFKWFAPADEQRKGVLLVVLHNLDAVAVQEILCFVAGKCCQEVAAQQARELKEMMEMAGYPAFQPAQSSSPMLEKQNSLQAEPNPEAEPPAKIPEYHAKRLVAKINRVIEENLDNDKFRVNDLARELKYCDMQLTRIFKQLIQQTPADYIHHFRLQRSRALLEGEQYSVKEIAFQVGFGSLEYFSRSFTKCYGECPSSFRRRIRAENA